MNAQNTSNPKGVTMFSAIRNAALAAIVPFLLFGASARANLVSDPGFESCTKALQSPPPGWAGTAACDNLGAASGTWDAVFGGSVTLTQSIATTIGGMYDFSFLLETAAFNPADPNFGFTASFGPDVVLNLAGTSLFGAFHVEDFRVTAAAASTTISLTSSNDATWVIDDVSVTAVAAPAPEPASGVLLLAGVAGLGLVRRTRRTLS